MLWRWSGGLIPWMRFRCIWTPNLENFTLFSFKTLCWYTCAHTIGIFVFLYLSISDSINIYRFDRGFDKVIFLCIMAYGLQTVEICTCAYLNERLRIAKIFKYSISPQRGACICWLLDFFPRLQAPTKGKGKRGHLGLEHIGGWGDPKTACSVAICVAVALGFWMVKLSMFCFHALPILSMFR